MVDVSNLNSLEGWTGGQPRGVAIVIAARAALRVAPMLLDAVEGEGANNREPAAHVILPAFRAMAAAWVAAIHPSGGTTLADAVRAASIFPNSSVSAVAAQIVTAARFAVATAAFPFDDAAHDSSAAGATAAVVRAVNSAVRSSTITLVVNSALQSDVDALSDKRAFSVADLARQPLWSGTEAPRSLVSVWGLMKEGLLSFDEDWQVWTDWYEDRLYGRPPSMAFEVDRVLIPNEIWEQGPKILNARIKELIEEHRAKEPPPTPLIEAGPSFTITSQGLTLSATSTGLGGTEVDVQTALHNRLKRQLPLLVEATRKVGNTHPGLKLIVDEYSELASTPLDQIDQVNLWACGCAIMAQSAAFESAPRTGMLTEPLEPDHLALLVEVARMHGGFILGFPKGVELTQKADRSRLSGEVVAAIAEPANAILDALQRDNEFVESRTRKFIAAIREGPVTAGWEVARAGHAVDVTARNSLIQLGRLALHANSIFATVVGGLAMSSVDPGLAQTQLVLNFILTNAKNIMSFSAPFPELREWFKWIIDEIDKQDTKRT